MSENCVVPGCLSNGQLFKFPRNNEILLKQWIKVLDFLEIFYRDLKSKFICENHFNLSEISENLDGKKELDSNSIPSIFKVNLDVCRFCLKSVGKKKIDREIQRNFRQLFDKELPKNETLPKSCCKNCADELNKAASTKSRISNNQDQLFKLLNHQTSTPIKQEQPDLEFFDIEPKTEIVDDPFLNSSLEDLAIPENEVIKSPEKKKKSKYRIDRVPCPDCGLIIQRDAMKKHRDRIHLKIMKFECDLCGQKIHMKTELQTHMRIRHTVDRPRHQCPGCEKTFLEKKTLSRHFKFIHKGHVQKICDICGKIFQTTYLYNDHYRKKHSLETPYECEELDCSYKCSTSHQLWHHRTTTHAKQSPNCQVCNKQFPSIKHLQTHLRLVHLEKRFICEFENCGKKFPTKSKLKFHRDKHMGVKKFECGFELCNAQYQKKSHLLRHQDVKHLKIPYNCEVAGCSSRYTRKEFLKAHLINNHKDLECLEILLDNLKNLKVKIDEADYKIIKLD